MEIQKESSRTNLALSCVKRGLGFLGEDVAQSTAYFLETKTGTPLDQLVPNEPERFCLAIRELFGLGSALVFSKILWEIRAIGLLAATGDEPLSRLAIAVNEAKDSVDIGIL